MPWLQYQSNECLAIIIQREDYYDVKWKNDVTCVNGVVRIFFNFTCNLAFNTYYAVVWHYRYLKLCYLATWLGLWATDKAIRQHLQRKQENQCVLIDLTLEKGSFRRTVISFKGVVNANSSQKLWENEHHLVRNLNQQW